MRDAQVVKNLAFQCRPLIIVLLVAYCMMIIIFATAEVSTPKINLTTIPDEALVAFYSSSKLNFILLACLSFVGCVLSALFLTATFVMNVWLALPYLIMHCLVFIYVLALVFIYFDVEINRHIHNEDHWTDFGVHLLYHYGSVPMFAMILLLALLIFAVFPMITFMRELYLYRKEKKLEEKIKQQNMELVGQENHVHYHRHNLESNNSAGTEQTAPLARRASNVVITEETAPGGEVIFRSERRESRVYPVPASGSGGVLSSSQAPVPSVQPKKSHHHHHRRTKGSHEPHY